MTSKNTIRFNFIVLTLFLGVATGLFLILGVSNLMWYTANQQIELGFFIWMLCFIGAAGCVWGNVKYGKKLYTKYREMVS